MVKIKFWSFVFVRAERNTVLPMWAIIFIAVLYFILEGLRKPHKFPPGPPTLPLVGCLLLVVFKLKFLKYHHAVWQSWAQKYGDILGIRLGPKNIVVVSGKNKIKEVCSREVFDGRPDSFFYTMRSFGKKLGVVFSDGQSWNVTRKAVLKYLRSFGYGSQCIEKNIFEECKALVELRMQNAGTPVVVNSMFDVSIVNILWKLVAGKRYDLSDPRLKKLCSLVKRSFHVVDMSGGFLNCMPFLRHIIPGFIGYTELVEIHEQLYEFIGNTISEHKKTLDAKNPRDVVDVLLLEMMEKKENAFTEEELQVVCLDLLQAGLETVSNTIVFMFLYIALNDDIQKRLHQEIDEMIGERLPIPADRTRMIYAEAVALESLRMSTVPPVGIPHVALDDATLGKYVIPKGTLILLSMHDLHNGKHWKEPEIFRPERFITKEGNLIIDDWFMPFGTGRRRCIGEGLARTELFMFLTHILQKFHTKIPKEDPLPSTDPVNGITLSAQPFRLIFEPRK